MFVSCLELPNKDLGRREALLRLFALKMNNMGGGGGGGVGGVKVGVIEKKSGRSIWKSS